MSDKGRFGGRGGDDDDEEASWLESYSDLVTDLMAIFVVLFSFAMMNQAIVAYNQAQTSMHDISSSIAILEGGRTANNQQDSSRSNDSNNSGSAGSSSSSSSAGAAANKENIANVSLQELEESLAAYIDEANLSDYLSISQQGENTVLLRMSASILFDSGQAIITQEARVILDRISDVLSDYGEAIELIEVEGHADTQPINTALFPSNWELSSTRAVNVVKFILQTSGLQPEQLSAVGYAGFHPIADNDTVDGMAKNRRVDFIIGMKQMPEQPTNTRPRIIF